MREERERREREREKGEKRVEREVERAPAQWGLSVHVHMRTGAWRELSLRRVALWAARASAGGREREGRARLMGGVVVARSSRCAAWRCGLLEGERAGET